MIDPKAPDNAYFEWPGGETLDLGNLELWQKANPPINDIRKKFGYPKYDGSLEDALKLIKEE